MSTNNENNYYFVANEADMDEIATLHFVMSLLSQNARNAMTLLIDEIATAKAFAYAKRT